MKQFLFFTSLIICILSGCQKEVEINLDDSNPKLPVFSGWITTTDESQEIIIRETSNFSSSSNSTYLTNATVTVTNNTNTHSYDYNSTSSTYLPSLPFVAQQGDCKININLNGKNYSHNAPILDPIIMDFPYILYDDTAVGSKTGIVVPFELPSDSSYSILFELLVDSSGTETNYQSLTPKLADMMLFKNHMNEYNYFGDLLLFNDLLTVDEFGILYKLIAHRISDEQYEYILRYQDVNDGNLYSPIPTNVPPIFSNGGLGIVIISADSYINFYL